MLRDFCLWAWSQYGRFYSHGVNLFSGVWARISSSCQFGRGPFHLSCGNKLPTINIMAFEIEAEMIQTVEVNQHALSISFGRLQPCFME